MLPLINAVLIFTGSSVFISLLRSSPIVPKHAGTAFSVLAIFLTALSLLKRFLITSRTLDGHYCVLMAFLNALVWMEGDQTPEPSSLMMRCPSIMALSFMLGLFNTKVWLNFVMLAALACNASVKVLLAGQNPAYMLHAWLVEFCTLAWISHCLTTSVRLEILAGDRGTQLTAVGTLLNTICDVVVELDSCLRMLQHSPKLADVLLRGGGRSLSGARFQDFMPEEVDRERFAQHMNDLDEKGEGGGVFHAKMRDSAGSNISMEFFTVAFRGSDASQRHILGMREFTDIAPVAHLQQFPPPRLPREEARHPLRGTPAAVEQGDTRSHGPSASSASRQSEQASEDSGSEQGGRFEVETKYMARKISMAYLLFSWHFAKSEGECCPWHRCIAEAQRTLATMVTDPCDPEHKCTDAWQCKRCGMAAQEYRDVAQPRQCKLCVALSDEHLGLSGAASAGRESL